ncbi:glycosyltransferase family 4 protein [bacterium]|nr:glycosyltransferase family 4 protein [bacterium]
MAEKKKLLYLVTQSELGGAQRYIFDLVTELQNDYEIMVAFGEQGAEGELAKMLKPTNAVYYSLPNLKRDISPVNDFLAWTELLSLFKKLKPDIIHLNSSKISILGSLAGYFTKAKIVYTAHGWVFNEPSSKKRKNQYKIAERFTARFKDDIICVSEEDRRTALKERVAPEKKLTTIHNGIRPTNFLSRQEARKKLLSDLIKNQDNDLTNEDDTAEQKFLIGSIGNLYKNKGFEYFINAVKTLRDNALNVEAVIIGEGKEREELENWIDQVGLKNIFFLAGRINNAAELLPAFDLYVCSSVKEGLSYTLIEAKSAKLPIVATSVGGNPELIEDKKTGLLVKPASVEDLANNLYGYIYDSDLREKLSQAAKELANKEFTLEKMIAQTKKIYES